ncbi:molybdenum cofactor guanylyltransferase [Aspergillus undulatus]|uniref:molybdenum cofactor guanylyltransferase n=1 Tax=Aspergillus undulatus TaxID=1810928 RepID=UPI003CCDF89E
MYPLLLAGGRSSRMGSRKELLCLTNDIPIYEQQLLRLHRAFPDTQIFLSLPTPRALAEITTNPRVEHLTQNTLRLGHQSSSILVEGIYDHSDEPLESAETGIGPAAGLLAAHRRDRSATWLVVACDYPFFDIAAINHLSDRATGDATCFENEEGIYEPLLGVWTPPALKLLEENVNKGILGPKSVVLKLELVVQHEYTGGV